MRREEESQAIAMRKVSLEGIGSLVPGDSTIDDVWIEYGGLRVTEVPAGEKFDIHASYRAINVAGGQWKATVTVKGDGIQNYEDTCHFGIEKSHSPKLDKMGDNIMPDSDITLRFKLWLHDDCAQDYPPVETW